MCVAASDNCSFTSSLIPSREPEKRKNNQLFQKDNKQKTFIIRQKIIAVIDATFTVAKRKPEKNSGLYGLRGQGFEYIAIVVFVIRSKVS